MTKVTQRDIERYAELKRFEKSMTEEIKTLGASIKDTLESTKSDEVEVGDGSKIILSSRAKWSYSDAVLHLEAQLDNLKEKEKANGTATEESNSFIMFKEAK